MVFDEDGNSAEEQDKEADVENQAWLGKVLDGVPVGVAEVEVGVGGHGQAHEMNAIKVGIDESGD